jgi:hypothetical protein
MTLPTGRTTLEGIVITSSGKPGKPFIQNFSNHLDYLLETHLQDTLFLPRLRGSQPPPSTIHAASPRSPCPRDPCTRPRLGAIMPQPWPPPIVPHRSGLGCTMRSPSRMSIATMPNLPTNLRCTYSMRLSWPPRRSTTRWSSKVLGY